MRTLAHSKVNIDAYASRDYGCVPIKYRDCEISEFKISHAGALIDLASVQVIDKGTVRLRNGTVIDQGECEGKITFTTPGLSKPLTVDMRDVDSARVSKE